MELKMFIGNSLIDSIPVVFSRITVPGYLESLKEKLEKKHNEKIETAVEKPLFFIDRVPSSMNPGQKKKPGK